MRLLLGLLVLVVASLGNSETQVMDLSEFIEEESVLLWKTIKAQDKLLHELGAVEGSAIDFIDSKIHEKEKVKGEKQDLEESQTSGAQSTNCVSGMLFTKDELNEIMKKLDLRVVTTLKTEYNKLVGSMAITRAGKTKANNKKNKNFVAKLLEKLFPGLMKKRLVKTRSGTLRQDCSPGDIAEITEDVNKVAANTDKGVVARFKGAVSNLLDGLKKLVPSSATLKRAFAGATANVIATILTDAILAPPPSV